MGRDHWGYGSTFAGRSTRFGFSLGLTCKKKALEKSEEQKRRLWAVGKAVNKHHRCHGTDAAENDNKLWMFMALRAIKVHCNNQVHCNNYRGYLLAQLPYRWPNLRPEDQPSLFSLARPLRPPTTVHVSVHSPSLRTTQIKLSTHS